MAFRNQREQEIELLVRDTLEKFRGVFGDTIVVEESEAFGPFAPVRKHWMDSMADSLTAALLAREVQP